MLKRFLLLLAFLILDIYCTRTVNFTKFHLSPYVVDHRWNEVENIIKGPPITQLIFETIILSNEALKRLLNMQQISNSLNSLKIKQTIINQETIKLLWQSKPSNNIINLTLDINSIQDGDFIHFPSDRQLNIQELSLQSAFLGAEGMGYLSNLKLNKLRRLNLYATSLVTDQAVSNLLKLNLSKLTDINIGFTAVSSNNALKILNALQIENLVSLNISKNNFDASFYKNFSQLNFKSLKTLDISELLIDESAIKYFNNLKFPQLTTLQISGNQIFIDGLYTFLNQKNYPKLTKLKIYNTILQDNFFKYFAKQFVNTNFIQLQFDSDGIQPQIFIHFTPLNFSSLQRLIIQGGFMQPKIVQQFFTTKQLNQLQILDLSSCTNTGNILQIIFSKKWPKLRILRLNRPGKLNFQLLKNTITHDTFPMMQSIGFDASYFTVSQIRQIIYLIAQSSQKLISLQISVNKADKIIRQIANKKYNDISTQIIIQLDEITQQNFNKLYNKLINAFLAPNKKPVIYYLNHYYFFEKDYKSNHKKQSPLKQIYQHMDKQFGLLLNNFDYSEVKLLQQNGNCTLLKYFVQQFQKQQSNPILFHTNKIILENVTNICYNKFIQLQFPNLLYLNLKFDEKFQSNASNFTFIPNNISQVQLFYLLNQNTIPNQKILEMFKRQKFVNLVSLYVYSSDLTSKDFQIIFKQNMWFKRLRAVQIIFTTIKQLNFLVDNKLKIRNLKLNGQQIGRFLVKLSQLNFQFMRAFRMVADGITNQQFLQFLTKVSEKHTPAFPRIQEFSFPWNNIETSAIKKALKVGIPMATVFNMNLNKDPNIVNTMLGTTQQHRIKQIIIYRNQQDSIDPNLNPKNTRQLTYLLIQAAKLQKTDFQALSKLDFRSLNRLIIMFSKFFQCQTFEYIRKIAIHVKNLALVFNDQVMQLTSQCMNGTVSSDQNLKHLSAISIDCSNFINTNAQKFFNLLIFDQVLQFIVLQGVYPSQKSFRKLAVQANLQYLNTLALKYNDLTDQMVSLILDRQYRQLKIIQLANNPRLTSSALTPMKNKVYYNLEYIVLSHTSINDAGIQILLTCQFPSLKIITLADLQITTKSLVLLSNLKAPNLIAIDFSNNNFSGSDLLLFNVNNYKYLQQIVIKPYMTAVQVNKLKEHFNKNKGEKDKKIQIKTEILNYGQIQQNQ